MELTNEIRHELMEVMTAAIRAAGVGRTEKLVTGKRLCEMYQIFNPSWLKHYGYLLPQAQMSVVDPVTGKSRATRTGYNVEEIQKMINENKLVLVMREKECMYKTSHGSKGTSRKSDKHNRKQ